ncbi:RrF2 family transcriptional regulator [Vallicoccus soli]|uniref:Rrf2 family transcriptional regulator n=1 Tax=Vallicoccus soli TaxID=2339232 RepID=A0A3A3Z097_9ACTN|nr:Rrf2 family transcriptional regulator [Vallicoccus soli]RJK96501.1 Rrf2 family transcriptional regulator [Vallicoccus soli]
MHISAKSDYAVRALLALAERHPQQVRGEDLAAAQDLPRKFLEAILGDLRRAGIVRSQRGAVGGFSLLRAPDEVTVGQVLRAVDGPLAEVRGLRPDQTEYAGVAEHLPTVWVAARAALREVLDEVTLADVLSGELPPRVREFAGLPGAWAPR